MKVCVNCMGSPALFSGLGVPPQFGDTFLPPSPPSNRWRENKRDRNMEWSEIRSTGKEGNEVNLNMIGWEWVEWN